MTPGNAVPTTGTANFSGGAGGFYVNPAGTAFGGGAHICPGRNAALVLGEVALRALTSPTVQVRLVAPGGGWVPGTAIRQRHALPAEVRPAAAA